jgi:hypothetical protein
VVHIVDKRNAYGVLVGIPEGKRPLCVEYVVIDGRMIVRRIVNKQDGCGLDYSGPKSRPLMGYCGHRMNLQVS